MLKTLALMLLLGLPVAAQQNDNSGAGEAAMSQDSDKARKDRVADKAAKLRERAAKLEEKGDAKAAAALRRRADRLEQRQKAIEEKRRERRAERGGEGAAPKKGAKN